MNTAPETGTIANQREKESIQTALCHTLFSDHHLNVNASSGRTIWMISEHTPPKWDDIFMFSEDISEINSVQNIHYLLAATLTETTDKTLR